MLSKHGTGEQIVNKMQEQFLDQLADLFSQFGVFEVSISNGRIDFEGEDFEIAFNKYEDDMFHECFGSFPDYGAKNICPDEEMFS